MGCEPDWRGYREIPIAECAEPMLEIPERLRCGEHPYLAAGAPYGSESPWRLRRSALEALLGAAAEIEAAGARLRVRDAYRPNRVQAFMIEAETRRELERMGAKAEGIPMGDLERSFPKEMAKAKEIVARFWAEPSESESSPPPHSAGGAVDVDLAGPGGEPLWMGSAFDEMSERSAPGFAFGDGPEAEGIRIRRELLRRAMVSRGFAQHPGEWWHFSMGDQLWALLRRRSGDAGAIARYGRADRIGDR